MGEYYNKGWSVADTNIVVSIARRIYPASPVDKYTLKRFVRWAKKKRPGTITNDELSFICSLAMEE